MVGPDLGGAHRRLRLAQIIVIRLSGAGKYREASGAATARISTDQASDASMGCCIGQAWIDADGFGLCQSWRAPAVTALTGFQS